MVHAEKNSKFTEFMLESGHLLSQPCLLWGNNGEDTIGRGKKVSDTEKFSCQKEEPIT